MNSRTHLRPFSVLVSLFFMWGFLTCMNDILIPYLKDLFDLAYWQAMLVQFAFFGAYFLGSVGYFLLAMRSGDPIRRIGYKWGIVLGLIIAAVGCLLFFPAAQFGVYGLFLGALFILGLGFTLLQIAANPYVTILGPESSSSSRLNLAQAFNSLGTTLAPIIGGYLVFEYLFSPEAGGDSVKIPYLAFGGIFLLMALLISRISLPVFHNEGLAGNPREVLKHRHLVLGILAIFMYVGGEVTVGSFVINYLGLPDIAGLDESIAKNYLAFYWGGAMIGRFGGAISLSDMEGFKKYGLMLTLAIGSYLLIWSISSVPFADTRPFLVVMAVNFGAFMLGQGQAGRTLGLFAILCLGLLFTTMFGTGSLAMWAILSIGLFNSIMWPNIFSLAIHGLGAAKSQGSSLLVMAILGGALIPVVQGWLADYLGVKASFWVPICCYAYIVYYGFWGSRNHLVEDPAEQSAATLGH
ncbi:sugar MFS transporter [Pontibacter sp. G13]|uniref:sugar MFS transporter n=1 Tax=Pontibacter sp. G13 TaxID=3074898 RepID=UPI002889DE90|nr:sugar MFS transporter [Pontibacter sp. G13]WNJ17700.1 sugar MFS transporter [Pontibacter sp. G13]